MNLSVVILAAGQGARMRSKLPKVLHSIGGVSLLSRIVSTVSQLAPRQVIIVHGADGDALKAAIRDPAIVWVAQGTPLGTGHAVKAALPLLSAVDRVLIVYGDIPLVRLETLEKLLVGELDAVGLVTVSLTDPTGFGRIVRDSDQKLLRIVEEKDASLIEKSIQEINAGFFSVPKRFLERWLPKLTADNAQQEYYLTDIISLALQEDCPINTISPRDAWEVLGVNDKIQLAALERIFQKEQALHLMRQGVTLRDPDRLDIRGVVIVGSDVMIDVNVILEGQVILEDDVMVGPNVYIKDSVIRKGAKLLANSVIEGATVGPACRIGPFARIRPGTELADEAQVGNFVELKNTKVAEHSKINHLSYIGDTCIGSSSNIGAGTITCNFDGHRKYNTVIGDNVFIGSDTQLIAPVTVGDGSTIGAGTTVTKDIPSNCLVHNRVSQRIVSDWKRQNKKCTIENHPEKGVE